MMMRSPYMRPYAPEYYSAADVQRMAEQLKRQALVWQGRYEQSQAAVEELQRELTRARRAQATENGTTRQQIETLQAEIEQIRSEADDWRSKFETAQAELQATQAEAEAEQAKTPEPETDIEQFVLDVLPFVDNLERAMKHADDDTTSLSLRDGIALTLRAFDQALGRYDIERIPAEGQPFDPTVHEAAGMMPRPDLPEGMVAEVEQNGYRHGARVLRPARVMVAG